MQYRAVGVSFEVNNLRQNDKITFSHKAQAKNF